MNLTIETALHGMGELLRERIAPNVDDAFAAQMTRLAGGLLNICANWVDDAAELRIAENGNIRAVLGEAAAIVDGDLAARLRDAAQSSDPGLKVSVLDGENHRLRLLLVEAQARLETMPDDTARVADQRIWRLLEDIERQRAPRE